MREHDSSSQCLQKYTRRPGIARFDMSLKGKFRVQAIVAAAGLVAVAGFWIRNPSVVVPDSPICLCLPAAPTAWLASSNA